jgi:dTDP-4-dehydrorhamnose 3,5-epimerase
MNIRVTKTIFPEVLILNPDVYEDERGFFTESYNYKSFNMATGLNVNFVQDNHSRSTQGVLRGLHYQIKKPQGKLVRVSLGEVFDVVVDMRKSSKNFGKWFGVNLSAKNKKQLWIPEGFAHGFLVLSDIAEFQYKTTDYRFKEYERSLFWGDHDLNISWPEVKNIIVSDKDNEAPNLHKAERYK